MPRGLALLSVLSLCSAAALADLQPDYWDGEVGLASAVRLHGDDAITQKQLYLKASLEDSLGDSFYKAKGRVRYDARYEGDQPYSDAARDEYRFTADWRHLYWGHRLGDGELTLGWQQVVWGRADELRVLDQVNPLDYREGLTALLEDSRIALPMARLVHPLGDWELEALWITDSKANRWPAEGSEFDGPVFTRPDPSLFETQPSEQYHGSEKFAYGLSANGQLGSVDVSLVGLNSRQQDPVYAITGIAADGRSQVQARHPRYSMLGSGIAIDPGYSLVIRSELAYFDNWQVTNPYRSHGSDQSNMLKGLLGVDYLWRDWLLSAQWQEQHLLQWQPGMLTPERDRLFTLSGEGSHLQDRLKTRLVMAFSPPADDNTLLQGIFTYKPTDWLKLGLEIDLFFGNREQAFGSYRQHDQVRLSAGYLF